MKKRRTLVFKIKNILFAIGTLCLTINLLSYQALYLAEYKNILRFAGIGLYILTVIMGFRKIQWKISLILTLLYGAVMYIFGEPNLTGNAINLVAIILIMLAAQCIEHEDMMDIFVRVAMISIFVWVILIVTGQIEIISWEATRISGIGADSGVIRTTRYSLGFLYEINLGAWYLTSALTVTLMQRKVTKVKLIIVSILNVIIYLASDSRTTFGFYVLFLLSYFALRIAMSKHKALSLLYLKKIVTIILAIIFLFPFIAIFIMNIIPWLDRFTSGRLWGIVDRMGGMTTVNYIFGWYYSPLACFYYLLLTQFGIIVYLLFYFIIRKGIKLYLTYEKIVEFCFIFSMLIVGIFESSIFALEELSTIVFWSLIGQGIVASVYKYPALNFCGVNPDISLIIRSSHNNKL